MEKLGNTQLKTFLEKYTKNVIPTPSNIRNNYITSSYEKKLGNLRLAVANHPFSVSIDETTDVFAIAPRSNAAGNFHFQPR